ncbi:MAG: RHS repeat protein [Deltaproteobacteria bacterium]|nr:RHS repeat protein [Deltaproteobacteria bacterium]
MIDFDYDPAGRMTSVVTSAGVYGYSYDFADRVETVTAPGGGTLTFAYDGSQLTYPVDLDQHGARRDHERLRLGPAAIDPARQRRLPCPVRPAVSERGHRPSRRLHVVEEVPAVRSEGSLRDRQGRGNLACAARSLIKPF